MAVAPLRPSPDSAVPLAVDLDGTLVRSDLLLESLFVLAKRSPRHLLLLPFWLARGRAALKREVAARARPDVASLPFREPLIAWLAREKQRGRRLVLATAADATVAEEVARHVGLFDQVLASDGRANLARERKRDRLIDEFGAGGFDYVGSGASDRAVWRAARKALVVGGAAAGDGTQRIGAPDPPALPGYVAALRPHQWLKNALVFVPLLAVGRIFDAAVLWPGLLVFVAFGLCASSAYLVNDLLDLPADRHHPRKRERPLASGRVPLLHGLVLAPLLLLAGLALAAAWQPLLAAALALYYALTTAYSLRLKEVVVLDLLALAGLYTARVMVGAIAFAIPLSPWLLAFCVFLFFSLAMVKRYAELMAMRTLEGTEAHARAYLLEDSELLAALGGASGYLAVLVLALYIVNDAGPDPQAHYQLIWLTCVLLLYWISYMWLMAHRRRMHDDPLVFALRDRVSQVVIALIALTLMVATT